MMVNQKLDGIFTCQSRMECLSLSVAVWQETFVNLRHCTSCEMLPVVLNILFLRDGVGE